VNGKESDLNWHRPQQLCYIYFLSQRGSRPNESLLHSCAGLTSDMQHIYSTLHHKYTPTRVALWISALDSILKQKQRHDEPGFPSLSGYSSKQQTKAALQRPIADQLLWPQSFARVACTPRRTLLSMNIRAECTVRSLKVKVQTAWFSSRLSLTACII